MPDNLGKQFQHPSVCNAFVLVPRCLHAFFVRTYAQICTYRHAHHARTRIRTWTQLYYQRLACHSLSGVAERLQHTWTHTHTHIYTLCIYMHTRMYTYIQHTTSSIVLPQNVVTFSTYYVATNACHAWLGVARGSNIRKYIHGHLLKLYISNACHSLSGVAERLQHTYVRTSNTTSHYISIRCLDEPPVCILKVAKRPLVSDIRSRTRTGKCISAGGGGGGAGGRFIAFPPSEIAILPARAGCSTPVRTRRAAPKVTAVT